MPMEMLALVMLFHLKQLFSWMSNVTRLFQTNEHFLLWYFRINIHLTHICCFLCFYHCNNQSYFASLLKSRIYFERSSAHSIEGRWSYFFWTAVGLVGLLSSTALDSSLIRISLSWRTCSSRRIFAWSISISSCCWKHCCLISSCSRRDTSL